MKDIENLLLSGRKNPEKFAAFPIEKFFRARKFEKSRNFCYNINVRKRKEKLMKKGRDLREKV